MMSIVTKTNTPPKRIKRGRPERTARERISTIAWFHAVATQSGERTARDIAKRIACLLSGKTSMNGISEDSLVSSNAVIAYRDGKNKPDHQRRILVNKVFPGVDDVLEHGPYGAPLWAAFWEPVSADYIRSLALHLPAVTQHLTLEEDVPFSLVDFAGAVIAANIRHLRTAHEIHLWVLLSAITVYRWHAECKSHNILAWYRLLAKALIVPGARQVLRSHGVDELVTAHLQEMHVAILEQLSDQRDWLLFQGIKNGIEHPLRNWVNDPHAFPLTFSREAVAAANIEFQKVRHWAAMMQDRDPSDESLREFSIEQIPCRKHLQLAAHSIGEQVHNLSDERSDFPDSRPGS